MTALNFKNVTVEIAPHFWSTRRRLVDDMNLEVMRGEVFGFLGPNGAGKTTTIKTALGLITPNSGSISVLGGDIGAAAIRRKIGFMPEHAYFPEHLTAHELVTQHALLAGAAWRDASRMANFALDRVALGSARSTKLRTYSKGMLQRTGLAQALVANPELIVLDEPMSGLDPIGRRQVRDVMNELKHAGKTIFFSTHILPDVETVCDRVGIIVDGKLRRVTALSELTTQYSQGVEVWSKDCTAACVESARSIASKIEQRGDSWRFLAPDVAQANTLVDLLRGGGASVVSLQRLGGTLEDAFMGEAQANEEVAS